MNLNVEYVCDSYILFVSLCVILVAFFLKDGLNIH